MDMWEKASNNITVDIRVLFRQKHAKVLHFLSLFIWFISFIVCTVLRASTSYKFFQYILELLFSRKNIRGDFWEKVPNFLL